MHVKKLSDFVIPILDTHVNLYIYFQYQHYFSVQISWMFFVLFLFLKKRIVVKNYYVQSWVT